MGPIDSCAAAEQLLKILEQRQLSVTFAESCTGGQMAASLTALPGASKVFPGSIVSYANSIKHQVLGVSEAVLDELGAVSGPVVVEMAQGACRLFQSDWAVSTSGIAGPTGGTVRKPVGLVFVGIVGPGVAEWETKQFEGDRMSVQRQTVEFGFDWLLSYLSV